MIKDLLTNKTTIEKSDIKSTAFTTLTPVRIKRKDYEIETSAIEKITIGDSVGIQLYVRAWDSKGFAVGFGDGTVEWERFRIFNPPILVPDGTTHTETVIIGGGPIETKIDNFKEDLQEALLRVLESNIAIAGKDGSKIIKGKMGSTVSTFYPSAGTNAPVDGYARTYGNNLTFANIRNELGDSASSTDAATTLELWSSSTTNQYDEIRRGIFGFNMTAIGTDVVSAATLSVYRTASAAVTNLGDMLYNWTSATVGNSAALAAGDFEIANHGSTKFSTGKAVSTLSTSRYHDWALNASGIAYIAASTKFFSLRFENDIDNNSGSPLSWASGAGTYAQIYFADQAGTTSDPKLVVTHSAGGGAVNSNFFLFMSPDR